MLNYKTSCRVFLDFVKDLNKARRYLDVLLCLSLVVILFCVVFLAFHQSKNGEDMQGNFFNPCPAWYGVSVYPNIPSQQEVWNWMLTFTKDLPATPNIFRHNETIIISSLRFTGTTTANTEQTYIKLLLQFETSLQNIPINEIQIPRYDCGHTKCVAKKRKLVLRDEELTTTAISADIIIIHALITDIYDVDRFIKSLLSGGNMKSRIIITAITIFPSRRFKVKEENLALPLYDFLQRLYFDYNYLPSITQQTCPDKKHILNGCRLWLTWTKFDETSSLSYIPPAGIGSPEAELQRLSSFLNHPDENTCRVKQKIGGYRESGSFIDGQYTICLDPLRRRFKEQNCLVYSFGIATDWTFDEAMVEAGCEVHSFDPSIGLPEHKRSGKHWFHDWGLYSNEPRTGKKLGLNLTSYGDIRTRLQHGFRFVDVLKVDVEGAEWEFLQETMRDFAILDSVGQFIVEVHSFGNWRELARRMALDLHYLEKRGFVLFNSRQNVIGLDLRSVDYSKIQDRQEYFYYELSFIKR